MNFTNPINSNFKKIFSLLTLLFFLPFLLYATYQAVVWYNQASGTKANISINASKITGIYNSSFYHAFAQGGEEASDMLLPVVNNVKALNPKAIRIDHIYDYYNVVSRNESGLIFDFSRLDNYINSITKTGASPVLSLSYMPSVIAKDGSIINIPNNWNEWSIVVQKTIEHYSGKKSKNMINVFYEVWNEPDLAQFGGWKTFGEKNYLTLYRYAVQGAANAKNVNRFFIGGPSTTGLYKNWVLSLADSAMRVDFFSWHSYLEDPERLITDQKNINSWLSKYPQLNSAPKLITEFGFTGAKDQRYSTKYAAAYTATAVRYLMDMEPYYIFSFQLKDGPNQDKSGGWGLLGHETKGAFKKPRYFVYDFLDRMYGRTLDVQGEGSWVKSIATSTDNSLKIMLINFDRNSSHTETVPITINNVPPGKYTEKIQYLFEEGCGINSPRVNKPAPLINIDGTYNKMLCIPVNNMVIIELSK